MRSYWNKLKHQKGEGNLRRRRPYRDRVRAPQTVLKVWLAWEASAETGGGGARRQRCSFSQRGRDNVI